MMNRLAYLAVAATTFAVYVLAMNWALGQERSWSLADMNRTIEETNFLVNQGCSGTLIDATNRYVLTNNHCVEGQYETIEREKISDDGVVTKEKIRRLRDGEVSRLMFHGAESVQTVTYKVRLVAVDREVDLALMQIMAAIPPVVTPTLACGSPVRGETAYIVGNPMGVLYASVVTGVVSSVQRSYAILGFGSSEQSKRPLMQISGGTVGGNSGGAVYNARGELIGVPALGHRINEVLGFAVPLESVREFLVTNKLGGLATGHCQGPG